MTKKKAAAKSRRKSPTILDVAEAAGVAVGTVSRVINRNGPVSAKAIHAVNAAIKQLNYQPDAAAQSLRSRNSKVIGCLIPDIANPAFAVLTKAAEQVFRSAGYNLFIASSDSVKSRELEILDVFRQRRVDGVLVSVIDERNGLVSDALSAMGVPIVALDRELTVDADSICYTHADGMAAAVEYLFELGHRRIALITGNNQILPTRERIRGYKHAFKHAGVPVDRELIRTGIISEQHGANEGNALLALASPPTAIIAGANQILVGVLRALKHNRRKVKQDVSVISCDDTPVAELTSPAITVIRRDMAEWGEIGAELLLDRLNEPKRKAATSRKLVLPCELVLRGSCAKR